MGDKIVAEGRNPKVHQRRREAGLAGISTARRGQQACGRNNFVTSSPQIEVPETLPVHRVARSSCQTPTTRNCSHVGDWTKLQTPILRGVRGGLEFVLEFGASPRTSLSGKDNLSLSKITLELTRGNRRSQFHKPSGGLASKVNSHYLSRSQWLRLPNPTARRRI